MLSIDPKRYIQALEKAPSSIRVVSRSEETTQTVKDLGERYNLGDRVSAVARITAYVLVGLVPITKFRETIQSEAKLEEDMARKIATEIRDKVFVRVVDELRAIHGLSSQQKPVPRPTPRIEGNIVDLKANS